MAYFKISPPFKIFFSLISVTPQNSFLFLMAIDEKSKHSFCYWNSTQKKIPN